MSQLSFFFSLQGEAASPALSVRARGDPFPIKPKPYFPGPPPGPFQSRDLSLICAIKVEEEQPEGLALPGESPGHPGRAWCAPETEKIGVKVAAFSIFPNFIGLPFL